MNKPFPRVVIAGMAGDSGKTLVTVSILSELLRRGIKTAAFKKGPDFIDAAWLSEAAGSTARNLDIYMTGPEYVFRSFTDNAVSDGINVIEGNRGLYDGMETGLNSSAELAKLLKAPVIIVMSPVKVTRTAAAHVLGCMHFDPDVRIAGVILNKVRGQRHKNVVTHAIEDTCGIPVLGVLPRLTGDNVLPDRHLGLVTPQEAVSIADRVHEFSRACRDYIDLEKVLTIAKSAPGLTVPGTVSHDDAADQNVRIGYFYDPAFTFYYPENLEALERQGAELVKISPLSDSSLPPIDALYIGGGFPETHAELLQGNSSLRGSVKEASEKGLPVYAECGGLMYLTESITWHEMTFEMAGVLPVKVEMSKKPQGHGYCEIEVDSDNPFFQRGTILRGHEFHYSRITSLAEKLKTGFQVLRGTGCFDKRDGLIFNNVLAAYTHVHDGSAPTWATGMINAAEQYKTSDK